MKSGRPNVARLHKAERRSSSLSNPPHRPLGGNYDRYSWNWFHPRNSANLGSSPDKTFTNPLRAGNTSASQGVFNEALSKNIASDCAEYENDSNRRMCLSGIVSQHLGSGGSTTKQR